MSETNHGGVVQKMLEGRTPNGTLKSRESATVEFKQVLNGNSFSKYAKTMSPLRIAAEGLLFLV